MFAGTCASCKYLHIQLGKYYTYVVCADKSVAYIAHVLPFQLRYQQQAMLGSASRSRRLPPQALGLPLALRVEQGVPLV
jgi:hypothetical protein